MKKLIIVLTVVLAGCAGTASTRAVNALGIACDSYATLLEQVSPLAKDGKLGQTNIDRISSTNKIVDKACLPGSKVDPAEAVETVAAGIDLLKNIKGNF